MADEWIVIDGSDKVLGRMGSQVAKMLLNGQHVAIVNAEKAVISGHMRNIVENYKQRLDFQDKANPEHSPYWSRRGDLFVKRVIRGMLPYKRPKGKAAFKLLRVYIGVPESMKTAKIAKFESKNPSGTFENTYTVQKLTEKLGYRVR